MKNGFTLFEVLIALAIVAIALIAAVRAANIGTESAIDLKERTLSGWVARNRMAEHVAFRDWPQAGTNAGSETEGGMNFAWREKITSTPNPLFRRIEISVFRKSEGQHVLADLTGYLKFPAEP